MKQIKGYPNYLVTTDGRIFSLINMRYLKQSVSNSGYSLINLRNNVAIKTFTIHRLVANTYVSNFDNKPQVNHIDGNKKNNLACNLEWVNASQNQLHSVKMGLRKSTEKQRLAVSKTGKMVGKANGIKGGIKKRKLIFNIENGVFYDGIQEAANSIGMKRTTLNARLVGQIKNETNLRYA